MVDLDLDHLRKIYSEYTTEELINYLLAGLDELASLGAVFDTIISKGLTKLSED